MCVVVPSSHLRSKWQLPDVADDFAADALGLGGATRDDAARGGHDRDAHAAEHALAAILAGIDAPARLGHALEAGEHALAAAAVLELDDERRVGALFRDVEVADVALFFEDAGDLGKSRGMSGCSSPPRSASQTGRVKW